MNEYSYDPCAYEKRGRVIPVRELIKNLIESMLITPRIEDGRR